MTNTKTILESVGVQGSLVAELYERVDRLRGAITEGWDYDIAGQWSKVQLAGSRSGRQRRNLTA